MVKVAANYLRAKIESVLLLWRNDYQSKGSDFYHAPKAAAFRHPIRNRNG
jgi:hypothetical protein